jgi:hypothetical protein
VSSATSAELSVTTGGSLTGATTIAAEAESVPPFPSEIEYVKLSPPL